MDHGDVIERSPLSGIDDRLSITARGGRTQPLGDLLQSFQPYLMSVARRGLPDGLRAKCDPADLVQETLLEAHRGLAGFNGPDSDAFRVWLCGILKHNLMDLIRRNCDAAKRAIGRERPLSAGPESGDPAVEEIDPYPTPCRQSIAREDVAAVREALTRLPAHERSAISHRYFDLLPFQQIGLRLGCSPEAARKLCSRAMARLQQIFKVTRGPRT
jgi:RNA polymerase sigma-70 factor (ECF subfamily)